MKSPGAAAGPTQRKKKANKLFYYRYIFFTERQVMLRILTLPLIKCRNQITLKEDLFNVFLNVFQNVLLLSLTLSVPQAVKRGSQILTFCTPSRETRLANKRLECEPTIGR